MSDVDSPKTSNPGGGQGLVPVDRRHVILERVADEQTIHVGTLAGELGVSEMTIRRDIRRLERDGFLRQTYGGATAHQARALNVAFNARALQHPREKRLIAVRAASMIDGARTIFFGVGTTIEQFARYFHARPGLTVVTASLATASLLGTRAVRTVAVGGEILRDDLTATGPIAVASLQHYHFDVAVISAAGVTARWGITEPSDEEADVQRTALRRSERVIVLADGSKVGQTHGAVVAPADVVETLVTDATAPTSELDTIRGLGVRVLLASRTEPDDEDTDQRPSGRGRMTTRS
jgi:DeoR family transcriptional regulator of aga operon